MYFSSSKDVLFIVLAFAVLWLAIFLSWALYYLICILKDAKDTIHGVRRAASAIESAAGHFKGKFESLLNIVSVMGEGFQMFMNRNDGSGKKKK
jgi:uncharacterized protein YoxC